MPLLLRCNELEPGMRLAEPLHVRGRVLLTTEKVLSHADVDALRKKHPEAWARVADPLLDKLADFEDDSRERRVAATAQQRISRAMSEVQGRFSARVSLASLNVQALRDSVTGVLQFLEANPVSFALLNRNLETESYLSEHAGNVFYLSMVLGCAVRDCVDEERRQYRRSHFADPPTGVDLLPLGLAAVFADVGMLPLQHLFGAKRPLTKEERQTIREHPIAGASMLPPDFPTVARSVVETHHENYDGSGYLLGLSGTAIHLFSRIVRIADAYDAATASHVFTEAKSPARALWEMSNGPYRRCYDPVLMKIFARLIQPFPIGAKLRLVDERYAVVVRYNREAPFKPTVVIAFDRRGERLPDQQLEGPFCLAERANLRIASFAGESLSFLYGTTSVDRIALTRQDFHTLFEAVYP